MNLKTILPILCAALAAGFAPAAHGQSAATYYLDVNGATPGFGNPNGLSIDWTDPDWTADPTGGSPTEALPTWYTTQYNPSQIVFGSPGTSGISNSVFTLTMNGPLIAGVVFNAPCTCNLASFNVFNFLAPETWWVPTNCTFNITAPEENWAFGTVTMEGGGTVLFNCPDTGRNAGNFIQNMTNGSVSFMQDYTDNSTWQASYELLNGTLNIATANAIGGAAEVASPSHYFNLSGGTLGNISGGAMTLNLGPDLLQIGGSFTFDGTNSLDFGTTPVNLGTVTPTITVTTSTLEFDGPLTNTAGLTVAGDGILMLTATNTYSGNTTVSAGTLALSGDGSISNSPIIGIAAGATFDVSATGWSGSGSQTLAGVSTSGAGTVNVGGNSITLNPGDALSFQAVGDSSPSVGNLNVSGSSGTVNLNNNTVTINVSGSALAASTNTLMAVTGSLNGAANPTPVFTGAGMSTSCGAKLVTTSGSPGSLVLVVTNTIVGSVPTTTTVALTTGASSETYGGQLTFTATVTGTTTSPTGNVIFKNGANVLATVALTPGTAPISTATYTEYTSLNVAGSPYSIAAYYLGNSTYSVSDSSASPVAQTITPKALTYSGLTASTNALYDGTTVATFVGTPALQTAEAPGTGSTSDGIPYTVDAVTTGGAAVGVMAAKGVGAEPVTVTGVTVTGTGAGNYAVLQETGLVETVIPKPLTVSGLAINLNNPPALTGTANLLTPEAPGATTGGDGTPYSGDSVSLTGTPVGTEATNSQPFDLVVDVSGLSLAGANAANYSLMQPYVLTSPYANGPAYYLDVNGSDPGTGFGDPYGIISGSDGDWTTNSTSDSATEALPPQYNSQGYIPIQVTFGYPGTTGITNDTFTLVLDEDIAGIVFNAPCTCTLADFGIFSFGAPTAWSVITNSTLTITENYANWAFSTIWMLGGGTINFDCNDVGRNAGLFVQNMPNGTVNLAEAYVDTVTSQASYELLAGTLNFATTNALGGPGGGRYLNISGGTVGNTSGGAMTLDMGTATLQIDGSFAFDGTNSLDFGTSTVDLGTVTPTITVSTNTLEFDGPLTGTAGLTVAGDGILMLTATNTYTGNTTVNGGILDIAQASLATNSTITVASGATLQMDFAVTNTVNNLVLNGVTQAAGVYNAAKSSPYLAGTGSLRVLNIITPPARTNITFTVSGHQLVLNWPSGQGWLLQSNSVSLTNPNDWFTVTGATPPYTNSINLSTPAVFYRLMH